MSAAEELGLADDWRVEVAAMPSQVGCIAAPAPVLQTVEDVHALHETDRAMYLSHPVVAGRKASPPHPKGAPGYRPQEGLMRPAVRSSWTA